MSRLVALILVISLLMFVAACGSDESALPASDIATEIEATVDAANPDFSVTISGAQTATSPLPGRFVLRGQNLRYDDGDGVLLVDLTVTNTGDGVYPEPVTLRFTRLLPDGVTLWNPPGGGMTYEFGFVNDDAVWTPGETSLPLTVGFVVADGVAVGFSAAIGVGLGLADGTISGFVFEDLDGDGVRDEGETGVEGMVLMLEHDEREMIGRALTLPDGSFGFPGLVAGPYTVTLVPQPFVAPTGDPQLHVLLTTGPDGVSSFSGADFGVLFAPGDVIVVPAAADATVRADIPDRQNDNHGADPFLAAGTSRDGTGSNDRIRGYMRFEVPPADSTLATAHLELTIAAFRDGSGQTYELVLNPVVPSGDRTPWIEGNGSEVMPLPEGVVWVDQAYGIAWIGAGDGGDPNNQTQPDFAPDPVARLTVVQAEHRPGDVLRFDVTELVRGWMTGRIPNEGVVLRDVGDGSTFRQLWCGARDGLQRGYMDSRVQPGPRLILSYR